MALVRTASGVQTIRLKKQQQKGTQRWYVLARIEEETEDLDRWSP